MKSPPFILDLLHPKSHDSWHSGSGYRDLACPAMSAAAETVGAVGPVESTSLSTDVVVPSEPSNRKKHAALAILERVVYRSASASSVLLLAAFGSPVDVGHYAFGLLALTLVQAIGETALRQAGVLVLGGPLGYAFVRRAALVTGGCGFICMACIIYFVPTQNSDRLALLPLTLVPVISTAYLTHLVRTQRAGMWSSLAKSQTVGSTIALGAAFPIFWLAPTLAATTQTALTEIIFGALVVHGTRRIRRPPAAQQDEFRPASVYGHVAVSNGIAWGQTQGERVSLGLFGTASALGLYTFAFSVTRNLAEAMISGLANHLRTSLESAKSPVQFEERFGETLTLVMLSSLGLQVLTSLGAALVPAVLGEEWRPSVSVVPLLACGMTVASVTGVTTVAMIQRRAQKALVASQVLGLLMSFAVGLLLAHSLLVGAVFSTVKEMLLLALRIVFCRNWISSRHRQALVGLIAGQGFLIVVLLATY